MGRLVITHSTYLEGLIPALRRLARLTYLTETHPVLSALMGRMMGEK